MSSDLEVVSRPVSCRLCGSKFNLPAGVRLDQTPDQRAGDFTKRLIVHLRERHKTEATLAAMSGQEYAGMLMLLHFNLSNDVMKQADELRWKINKATRAVNVSDERIDARVRSMLARLFTQDEIDKMLEPGGLGHDTRALVMEMRDVLIEAGRYPG